MVIEVSHTISMGHRLPSYDGICSSPHGHNVVFDVAVEAKEDEFIDFKLLALNLKLATDEMDHAMVLHIEDPLVGVLQSMNFRVVSLSVEPTTEAIAQLVYNELDKAYRVLRVTVHETAKYSATCLAPSSEVWRVR